MKIVRFLHHDIPSWGVLTDDETTIKTKDCLSGSCSFHTFITFLEHNRSMLDTWDEVFVEKKELLAPIMPTKNIICIGKNYVKHVLEFNGNFEDVERVRNNPIFFTKAISSINTPYGDVPNHQNVTNALDYEVELGVVIGKKGTNIPEETALDYVFGYTIINDMTARDLQKKHQQWFKGKSLDGLCPVGPFIVTKDMIKDPNNLAIKSFVNDEVRQNASTNQMIHSVKKLIHVISQGVTLNPGDVIATGTPDGVGIGFDPPKLLVSGDIVRAEIESIGWIENRIK